MYIIHQKRYLNSHASNQVRSLENFVKSFLCGYSTKKVHPWLPLIHLLLNFEFNCWAETVPAFQDPIENRRNQVLYTLQSPVPIILLTMPTDSLAKKAQEILTQDRQLIPYLFEKETGKPLLNEVFSVSKSRPGDYSSHPTQNWSGSRYRIDIYNYALNSTIMAIVDVLQSRVVDISYYKDIQPDLPPHLAQLAVEIAIRDTEVRRAYGGIPDPQGVRMSSTKIALNQTRCQRSQYLCVAPTFVQGGKALWCIVDLTDLKVNSIKWSEVGTTGMVVSERLAQNEKMMSCCCEVLNNMELGGVELCLHLNKIRWTSGDGCSVSGYSDISQRQNGRLACVLFKHGWFWLY